MTCTSTCVSPSPTQAHCGSCHLTWSGISLFDRHRNGGRCWTPAELIEAKVKVHDVRGVWRLAEARPRYYAPT